MVSIDNHTVEPHIEYKHITVDTWYINKTAHQLYNESMFKVNTKGRMTYTSKQIYIPNCFKPEQYWNYFYRTATNDTKRQTTH